MEEPSMSKEYNSALQARVEQFLKEKNISQAKAAPLMGISQTALSQYRRSMYDNGDIAALERKRFRISGISGRAGLFPGQHL